MALTLNEIESYTNNYIVPATTMVVSKNCPILVRLDARKRPFAGGMQIRRPIIYNLLPVVPMTRGGAIAIDEVKTSTAITAALKVYATNITLFAMDQIQNKGDLAAFSIIEEKFGTAAVSMSMTLAEDLYQDSLLARTNRLTGLNQWVDDGNTYTTVGGITRTDLMAAGLVGGLNAYTAAITSFTLRAVNTAMSNATWGAEAPDLIVCNMLGWNKFWESVQPLQRYQDMSADMAKMGFTAFRFNQADVVMDKNCPTGSSGRMFGLNTKYMEWYRSTDKQFDYGFTGFKKSPSSLDYAGQFTVAGELVMPNPRTSFKLTSTTEF